MCAYIQIVYILNVICQLCITNICVHVCENYPIKNSGTCALDFFIFENRILTLVKIVCCSVKFGKTC